MKIKTGTITPNWPLGRVEQTVSGIKDKLAEHEERMEKLEERVGAAKDAEICHRPIQNVQGLIICDERAGSSGHLAVPT